MSEEIPQLQIDEELKMTIIILIHDNANMISHTNPSQKFSKNGHFKAHQILVFPCESKKWSIGSCTFIEGIKSTFNHKLVILLQINCRF